MKNTMKSAFVAVAAVFGMAMASGTAFATTASECQTQIATLKLNTDSQTFRNSKDESTLLGKLADASMKLDLQKK